MKIPPSRTPRVLLIGGSSHSGKSTVARAVAERLGWECRSTDKMARHPGRPWARPPRRVPPHVAEHYLSLEPEELLEDVVRHYTQNVWPQVADLAAERAADEGPGGLVLEGSAVLPELAVWLAPRDACAVWLTGAPALFRGRIRAGSDYEHRTERGRRMIDRFVRRTCLFNEYIEEHIARHGLSALRVHGEETANELASRCTEILQRSPSHSSTEGD